jgi:hypothetical protein
MDSVNGNIYTFPLQKHDHEVTENDSNYINKFY